MRKKEVLSSTGCPNNDHLVCVVDPRHAVILETGFINRITMNITIGRRLMIYFISLCFRHARNIGVLLLGSSISAFAGNRTRTGGQEAISPLTFFNKEIKLPAGRFLLQGRPDGGQMTAAEREWIFYACVVIVVLLLALLAVKFRTDRLIQKRRRAQAIQGANTSLTYVELKANDEFKKKLIAIIANDFSTPLKQISAITTRLGQQISDPLVATAFIKEISMIARGALYVFDNILKWVKLQLSGFVYVKYPCRPYEMLQGVLGIVAPQMEEKGIVFVNQVPQQLVVEADAEMLKMIQQHLLQLAIHFTDPGRLMVVSAWEELSLAHIRLITEPSEDVEEVLKSLGNWQHNMYALSYAMTEDFVHKMNGKLALSSVDQRYLVFHVTFPV